MGLYNLISDLPGDFRAFRARYDHDFGATEAGAPAISAALLLIAGLGVFLLGLTRSTTSKQPPCLSEPIPYITNLYQYWTNMERFSARAEKVLRHSSIVKVHLGPTVIAYMVRGAKNIQEIFKIASTSSIDNRILVILSAERQWGMPKKDVAKIKGDESGRAKKPLPGSENVPEKDRFFFMQHHIYTEHLSQPRSSNRLAEVFYGLLSERLDKQEVGTWETLNLVQFVTNDIAGVALRALLGTQIFEQHPDLVDAFWKYEAGSVLMFFGVPRWLCSWPYKARERLNRIMKDYMRIATDFHRDSPDPGVIWDQRTGASVARENLKYFQDSDYDEDGIAGFFCTLLLAQNSNTIPVSTWMIIEAIRDPELLQELREEVSQAFGADHTLDVPKLTSLPLLQSLYTETMRLHVSFNLPRSAREKTVLGGYEIDKGSLILVPFKASHEDEAAWVSPGHPASEFWARRHLRYTEVIDSETGRRTTRPEFAVTVGPNVFFPYGGGTGICPGRHFAKQEIFMIVAILLSKFDVEFVEWTNQDGSKSDRPALDDSRYVGMAGMPPDREMKLRWRRRW